VTARSAGLPRTQPAPWTFAEPWGARGWLTDVVGPVHWIEFGEATDTQAPPVVFVHGLGGSHLNWVLVGPALAEGRRAVALDLAGFGLSPGAGRDCSVQANARLLHRFLAEVVGAPAVLVGNSMGGAVSVLAAAAHPEAVAGLVLVDPALPAAVQLPDVAMAGVVLLSAPLVGERLMKLAESRLSSRQLAERVMRVCFADPARASEPVMAATAALAEHRRSTAWKEHSFLQAARSLMRLLSRPAHYRAMMRALAPPTLLIHGAADRLVRIKAARVVATDNPGWDTCFLPDVGHTPQLERPDQVLGAIDGWFAQHPGLTGQH